MGAEPVGRFPLIVKAFWLSVCLHLAVLAWQGPVLTASQDFKPVLEAEIVVQQVAARVIKPLGEPIAPLPEPKVVATPLPVSVVAPVPVPVPVPAPIAVSQSAPSPASASGEPPTMAPAGSPSLVTTVSLPAPPRPIADTAWYPARQLDVMPRALASLQPPYPRTALRDGVEGSVALRMRVDAHGALDAAEIVESKPPGVFDAAVLAHLQGMRFTPAQRNGMPVRADLQVRLRFKLESDDEP